MYSRQQRAYKMMPIWFSVCQSGRHLAIVKFRNQAQLDKTSEGSRLHCYFSLYNVPIAVLLRVVME